MKGYVQVYTGNGKGKTTAAIGLALRAAGAGLKIYMAQFAKAGQYSEITALSRLGDRIRVEQFGTGGFIAGKPEKQEFEAAGRGLAAARSAMLSGQYDMVILDEGNIATSYNLITPEELVGLIESKPENVELVITGRNADEKIIACADLVTEMREVKHYFAAGVPARDGIER